MGLREKEKMQFDDHYDVSIFLNKGHFGDVYRCFEKSTGNEFAVKIITFRTNTDGNRIHSSREGAIWRRLKHRNIVELIRIFRTPTEHYLVMENVKDGNLFDQVVNFTTYTERDACHFMRQLLETLVYLREKRIIHRDIRTDNLLVKQSRYGEILKLSDFGLAMRLEKGQKFVKVEANGAPLHLAPETILEKPVNYAVDAWSAGVILFTLLGGYPPFWNEKLETLYADIITRDVRMSSPYWDNVSHHAKELILGLLDKNPITRITAETALNHPWIDIHTEIPKMHRRKTVEKLKEFNARRKLRGAIFTVQTIYRMQSPKRSSYDGTKNRKVSVGTRLFKITEQERRSSVATTIHKDLSNRRKVSEVNVLLQRKNNFPGLREIHV